MKTKFLFVKIQKKKKKKTFSYKKVIKTKKKKKKKINSILLLEQQLSNINNIEIIKFLLIKRIWANFQQRLFISSKLQY